MIKNPEYQICKSMTTNLFHQKCAMKPEALIRRNSCKPLNISSTCSMVLKQPGSKWHENVVTHMPWKQDAKEKELPVRDQSQVYFVAHCFCFSLCFFLSPTEPCIGNKNTKDFAQELTTVCGRQYSKLRINLVCSVAGSNKCDILNFCKQWCFVYKNAIIFLYGFAQQKNLHFQIFLYVVVRISLVFLKQKICMKLEGLCFLTARWLPFSLILSDHFSSPQPYNSILGKAVHFYLSCTVTATGTKPESVKIFCSIWTRT